MTQKQALNIQFGQGLDQKTDPFQLQPGKMLSLKNTVFNKGGLLQKRNGFGNLVSIPGASSLTTYGDGLIGIGHSICDYSSESMTAINKGLYQQVSVNTLSEVRNSSNITAPDSAVASNGLTCCVYLGVSSAAFYQILDSKTGQVVVSNVALPATATCPRVFVLGRFFIITFLATVSATTHLRYISIPITTPTSPSSAVDLETNVSGLSAGYDGSVGNNNLYLAYNANDGGGAVRVTFLDSTLVQHNTVVIAAKTSNLMSVCIDTSGNQSVVYVTYWNSGDSNAFTTVYNQNLVVITAAVKTINTKTITELTSNAVNGSVNIFYQRTNTYSFSSVRTDLVYTVIMNQAGTITGSDNLINNSSGLASKSFYLSETGKSYVMVSYSGSLQPTYFLIDILGNIVAKLAYSNGGGYYTTQVLPSVTVIGSSVYLSYLYKDLITPVNKIVNTNNPSGIYTQNGVNLATFSFDSSQPVTADIGNNLHINGGYLWMYDGVKPVEHNFDVFPEDFGATWSATGGSMVAKPDGSTNTNAYFYQVTYEWTDGKGNLHRSSPSLPLAVTTSGSGSSGSVVLNIPTLRFTAKTSVRIVIYRWSVAQQSFYQVTSQTSPLLNDTTLADVSYTDTLADASIIGNQLIYTTGGVVENIGAPAFDSITLYRSRLFGIDSEDKNLLWYSKQVIEATPVEMSDLFTIYIAPTQGSQGSTGPMTALAAMDDKLIIFKANAIYYITGNGPDNTGANNDFSEPVFITSTVGCSDQQSIVLSQNGLMFQSNKGMWLLGRDLSTQYIGAPVEGFNQYVANSASTIPGTNQVRFGMSNGSMLMYDYYYGQWGEFEGAPSISGTIYQGLQTILDQYGNITQETPGTYLDGSRPVLISFVTGWFNTAGLRGFERFYEFNFLGTYLSPHKLAIQVAYDYGNPSHQSIYSPNNFAPAYGDESIYGGGQSYGGPSNIESFRIFAKVQKCNAFQISVSEIYDPSLGVAAGAGLSLSGINIVMGIKKMWSPTPGKVSVG